MTHLFFDCEFTSLHKDTSLISIGIVSETGEKFYAEIVDYDRTQLNDWLNDNVVSNLWSTTKTVDECASCDYFHIGTKKQIGRYLRLWLHQFDEVQFVSDVCHYDMVLLIDLLGKSAFDLPENINPSCHDINQDISKFLNISEKEAFNMNREDMLGINGTDLKHNALSDAEVIRDIYIMINEEV